MARRKVQEIQTLVAALPPCEARRRSLMNALYGAISDEDMEAIAHKQVELAREGDTRAARLVTDLVQAEVAIRPAPPDRPDREEVMLSDVRENLVRVISDEGPQRAPALAGKIHASLECVLKAMDDHHWFEKQADGWHITKQGRADVLGKAG
jgi:hypothetical protein